MTRTVLVADDEVALRRTVTRALESAFRKEGGVRILTAGTVDEALAILEREQVDLVVSDYRMPGRTGADLLEEVAARWPATARLLVTGYLDLEDADRAKAEVLHKPWDMPQFVAAVRGVLTKPGDGAGAPP